VYYRLSVDNIHTNAIMAKKPMGVSKLPLNAMNRKIPTPITISNILTPPLNEYINGMIEIIRSIELKQHHMLK